MLLQSLFSLLSHALRLIPISESLKLVPLVPQVSLRPTRIQLLPLTIVTNVSIVNVALQEQVTVRTSKDALHAVREAFLSTLSNTRSRPRLPELILTVLLARIAQAVFTVRVTMDVQVAEQDTNLIREQTVR